MSRPSKPIPGTIAIVFQFALLAGALYGAARIHPRLHSLVSPRIASDSPAQMTPAPESSPQKEIITHYSSRYDSPGGKYRVQVDDFQDTGTLENDTHNANLRLFHQETNKTLWKTTVYCAGNTNVFWSEDGRAAVVMDYAGVYRMLVWRAGKQVREFRAQKYLECEGVVGLRWSPNKQTLLLRTVRAMGSYDVNLGDLWCVRLPSGRARLLSGGSGVRHMEWLSNHKVRYKTVTYYNPPHGKYLIERFHTHEKIVR
jgi:hypothetical protein